MMADDTNLERVPILELGMEGSGPAPGACHALAEASFAESALRPTASLTLLISFVERMRDFSLEVVMNEQLKSKLVEISELAKSVPEKFQQTCFEVLLSEYLRSPSSPSAPDANVDHLQGGADLADSDSSGEDLSQSDIHVKARKFMEKNGISLEEINELFYKEDGLFNPLYEDLKTTKMAEGQVRIALLLALSSGLHSGDFKFAKEEVRKEAQIRKSYDSSNFSGNFKTNQVLFEGIDDAEPRLSPNGMKELGKLIKLLQ